MALKRRLVFYAWADSDDNNPFARLPGSQALASLRGEDLVLEHGEEYLTAAEVIEPGTDSAPTKLILHALHGPDNRPSEWGPGEGMRSIQVGSGRYTAFSSHVILWKDKVAAIETYANAPGLGRLSTYFLRCAEERVAFRPLFEQEAARKLEDLEGIRGLDYSIHDPVKMRRARQSGMIGGVMPSQDFPSISVSVGMSQKQPSDAYVDDAIAAQVHEIADAAEQLFDRITIRGVSSTQRTKTGKKKTVEVNLLSERLAVEEPIEATRANPSMPSSDDAFAALELARRKVANGGKLIAAVEARLALDAKH